MGADPRRRGCCFPHPSLPSSVSGSLNLLEVGTKQQVNGSHGAEESHCHGGGFGAGGALGSREEPESEGSGEQRLERKRQDGKGCGEAALE